MSRKKEKSISNVSGLTGVLAGRRIYYALGLALVLFFWNPVVDRRASIQWDAVDVHYPAQRYFAEEVLQGRLPEWTPFVFSGFPFLADPQVGAWYPLNWPFFLIGVTPWAIQLELVLHGALAVLGAFLLLRLWTGHAVASLVGALAYGLGGFFAGHSSHVGMYQGAALFAWLLYFAERAMEAATLRWASCAALGAGGIVLAGHAQTALYSMLGLGLFLVVQVALKPAIWPRAAAVLALAAGLGGAFAAVVILPGMELTAESIRAGFDFSQGVEGALPLDALATLFHPNALKTLTGPYAADTDITQTYFYSGLLLLPLAALGARDKRGWLTAGLLVALPVWYMMGPKFGLYQAGGLIPYLHQMRAPVNGWFVAGFGLASLAAFGVVAAEKQWRKPWLGVALACFFLVDLCVVNSWINPLTYGRFNYKEFFGERENLLLEVRAGLRQGTRVDVPEGLPLFGPLNATLMGRIPSTGGYNPLELAAYKAYRVAARKNKGLVNGLSALVTVDQEKGEMEHNKDALPMVTFPKTVRRVGSREESRAALAGLDPSRSAVAEGLRGDIAEQPAARLTGLTVGLTQLAAEYEAEGAVFGVISMPMYPGWRLTVDGEPARIYRTNHALMGAELPGGKHRIELEFELPGLRLGMMISGLALLLVAAGVISPWGWKRW